MAYCTRCIRRAEAGTASLRIELRNVTRRIDGRRLLDGIRLSVEPGRLLLLCGPNGAGKSTLLKVMAGLLPPTSGEVLLDGRPAWQAGPELRRHLGVLLHESGLYDELTVMENLIFAGRLFGVQDVVGAAEAMIERFGLHLVAREPAGRMSRGMRQRLSLGRALIHEPSVLLLDEPYAGLDVRWAGELTGLLAELRLAGTAILLVAHEWRTAWTVADEVAVIVRGRLALSRAVGDYDADDFELDYRRLVIPAGARESVP